MKSVARASLLLATIVFWPGCDSPQKAESLVASASQAMEEQDFARAEELALEASENPSTQGLALRIAGDAALQQKAIDRAFDHFARIPKEDSVNRAHGCVRTGQFLVVDKGQLRRAERKFREALTLQPTNEAALDGLSFLLTITARRWESAPFFLRLIQHEGCQTGHLLGIGVLEYQLNERPALERCQHLAPRDPLPALGLALLALNDNDGETALSLLRQAVSLDPKLLEAQARLGQVLLDQERMDELTAWHSTLPPFADDHPEIWVVRARWAQRTGDLRGAVRGYLEVLRRSPNHQLSTSQLSVVLFSLGETELAQKFAARSQQLLRFHEVVFQLRSQPENPVFLVRAAQRAEVQGRLWEARGWWERVVAQGFDQQLASQRIAEIASRLTPNTPQILPEFDPASTIDIEAWPLPKTSAPSDIARTYQGPPPSLAPVRFEDVAANVGLTFQYVNGHDPQKQGIRIYEVDGGGVGVLDYDNDGWPDIYLTQGSRWPPDPQQTEHLDRLFRNCGDGHFEDVTTQAGIQETGFGQGVAVGDYDNDGFPDLYIANIGRNRLYHNCGDGTFEDVTESSGFVGEVWTSSCVFADLNGDQCPDLFEVNYLKDDRKFDRVCPDRQGTLRICAPLVFDAEQNCLYVSHGDGTFEECGAEAGIHAGDAKGLGIVAADFDDADKLSLFVANDVTENFYFHNETEAVGESIRLSEQALVRGLAFSGEGLAQACMGTAVDDVNGDGLLDIFVANFYLEPNCLYLQQPDHTFVDVTRAAGLYDPSFLMLGFGAQFLDGELDGLRDLVVANGHLTDERDLGVPYQMRPQYFRNDGELRFTELRGEVVGPFFDAPQLGRGLATLDWNRDGREDFAITYLDRPAALVTNRTAKTGHFLTVSVCGTESVRDATGTKITVEAGGHTWRRQLIGGDGYQVSCQRHLIYGLGEATKIDRLTVRWPSGREQSWNDLAIDQELRFVEGEAQPWTLPR